MDELVEGDEKLGVPTVDPRQGKKFTRAGRKKTGRKAKPKSTKGRKPSRIESPEEEVDENLLFDIPEKAKILPSRAQMQARAEAGYGGENPDLPGDDEEDLPTDLLGEDEVLPMGSGAYPFLQEETHDDFVKRMMEHIDGPVPIWDVRITTKQGYEWVCGDVNSSNMPPIPVHPTFVPYGQPGPNIPGLERMPCCVVLEQFIPMSMYARIAQETNAYRARCKENTRHMDLDEQDFYDSKDVTDEDVKFFERDYDLKWEDQSIGSILRYIGMHQGMALRPRKNISEYWSKDEFGCIGPDNFSRYMSRNRFNLVKKYFYVNHAEETDFDDNGKLKDPWHKIRPFITVLQDNLLKNWNIGEYNSIDEGKIAYHGCCCPVLTFDRAKPIKWV